MSDTQIDLSDVKEVLALEASVKELLTALEAAGPAIERLTNAKYPGAGHIGGVASDLQLESLLEAVEDFREADGDWTVWDYRFLCGRMEFNLPQAAEELIGWNAIERIEPLRMYAESVA